jgi:hypothetical protein
MARLLHPRDGALTRKQVNQPFPFSSNSLTGPIFVAIALAGDFQ